MIPTWRGIWGKFGLDTAIGSCSILHDENDRSPKEFLFVLAFMVPCLCIVFCYARIFHLVRKAALRSREPASKPTSPKGNEPNMNIFVDHENKKNQEKISDAGGGGVGAGGRNLDSKPFDVADDIQFIDENYSLDNFPISYEKITENKSNVSSNCSNVSEASSTFSF